MLLNSSVQVFHQFGFQWKCVPLEELFTQNNFTVFYHETKHPFLMRHLSALSKITQMSDIAFVTFHFHSASLPFFPIHLICRCFFPITLLRSMDLYYFQGSHFLPPVRKLRQGNVFTPVCQSFCSRGVSWSLSRGSLSRGVSVQGRSLSRGSLSGGGTSVQGVSVGGGSVCGESLSQGVSVQRGLCAGGGLCPGGSLSQKPPPVR